METGAFKPGARPPFPAWGIGLGSFLLCWLTFLAYYHLKFHLNVPPAVGGDEIDYDAIGWQLARGGGFAVDTADPEFRRPYDEAARTEERFRLDPPRAGLITYRPPLFPCALGGLNRVFGRQFWAIRVMDAAFMAGTLALIAITLYRRFGWRAAGIALVLFVAIDVRTRLYGRAILTEAMSVFLTSVLIVLLLRFQESPSEGRRAILFRAGVLGLVFGLSILARSLLILWIPGLCLVLIWLSRHLGHGFRTGFLAAGVFLIGTGLVVSPWAVRNLRVTGEFMPLGTQGLVQMSAAFGDEIWASRGVWINLDTQGFFDGAKSPSQTLVEREVAKAKLSRSKAFAWIQANPLKALALFPWKIWQECRPRSVTEFLLAAFTLAGITVLWGTAFGKLMLAVVATNLFAIGVTWSVEGRFLVPVLFPIHVFAAAGALWMWAKATGRDIHQIAPEAGEPPHL